MPHKSESFHVTRLEKRILQQAANGRGIPPKATPEMDLSGIIAQDGGQSKERTMRTHLHDILTCGQSKMLHLDADGTLDGTEVVPAEPMLEPYEEIELVQQRTRTSHPILTGVTGPFDPPIRLAVCSVVEDGRLAILVPSTDLQKRELIPLDEQPWFDDLGITKVPTTDPMVPRAIQGGLNNKRSMRKEGLRSIEKFPQKVVQRCNIRALRHSKTQ